MEDLKQQGVNNDQGNNHMNLYSCENLHGSFNFNGDDYFKQSDCKRSNYSTTLIEFINNNKHKEEGWLNNRQDSSGEKDTVVSVVSFTHSNFDSGLSELSGPQSHLSNKEVQSSKGQGKQKNENEPVKFHEDGQTVKQDCISEQNQRNIPCVHNLRKSTRKRVCCLGIGSKENMANSNKKEKHECEKQQERKKAKRRGNTEKMRMKQEVKTLQRQVCALQEEIACLKQKLSLASPSKDFTLSSCHRKAPSFAGDVERAPLTPQSDGSATTIGRALVPNERKCIASRKYFCPKCTRSFSNYSLLCRHVGIHSGKKPYTCKVCNKTFNLANQLSLHKTIHSDEPRQHEEFSKGFTNSDLKSKVQIHRDIKAMQKECKVCGKRFSRVCHLLRHSLIHTGHRPFSCNACDKRFYKSDHLSRHMIIHTGRKPYQCDQCHKSYVTNSDLNIHKMMHSGERLHMCDICGLRFTRHAHMVRHSKVHTGEKPFYCDICGRSFSRLNHLQRHQKLHLDDPSFRCYLCSSEFGNKESLKDHISSHDVKKFLPCPWCGIEFRSKSKLLKHTELYHQKSDSTTGIGDSSLSTSISSSLKKIKEHVCDQCNKSYKTSGALIVHKRSHSGERPYICDICAISFSRSSSLVRHKRSHTGEKPHVCQICKKAYARRHQLSKHESIAHDSKGHTNNVASQLSMIDGIGDTDNCLRCDAPHLSSLPSMADNPTPFESSDHVNINAINENIVLDL